MAVTLRASAALKWSGIIFGTWGVDAGMLPLLNGMAHLDALAMRFGAARVLGGLCLIKRA